MVTLAVRAGSFLSPRTERGLAEFTEFLEVLDESAVPSRIVGETCECTLDGDETYAKTLSRVALSHC